MYSLLVTFLSLFGLVYVATLIVAGTTG